MCRMAHIDTKLGCLAAASITAIVLSVIVFSLHLARYEQIPPLNPLVACPSSPAWPRDMVIAIQLAIIVHLLRALRQDRTQPTGPTSDDERIGHEAELLSTGLPPRRGLKFYVAKDPGDFTKPQLLHTLPCCQGPWRLD